MVCRAPPHGTARVLKLYKKEGDTLHYWEAWVHEGRLTVHHGIVGQVGEEREQPVPPDEDPDMAIAEAAGPLVDQGYDEPDPDASVSPAPRSQILILTSCLPCGWANSTFVPSGKRISFSTSGPTAFRSNVSTSSSLPRKVTACGLPIETRRK